MGKVLEMTRMRSVLLIVLLATALSACSSDTTQSGSGKRLLGKSEPAAVSPRTAALVQQGAPAYVAVLEAREGAQSVFLRQTVNAKAEETWISNEGLSLGMKRGMVLATRGFGGDVLAIDASQTAAALRAGRLSNVNRFMTFLDGDSQARTFAFKCQIERGETYPIDFGTFKIQTVYFSETCRNADMSFINKYWVDVKDRRIIESSQWMGNTIGALGLRIMPR